MTFVNKAVSKKDKLISSSITSIEGKSLLTENMMFKLNLKAYGDQVKMSLVCVKGAEVKFSK